MYGCYYCDQNLIYLIEYICLSVNTPFSCANAAYFNKIEQVVILSNNSMPLT